MKIAIWGSYQFNNFGDDLMAVMFAGYARSLGLDPWVYRLHPRLAELAGCHSTEDLDELLSGAEACFLGGGAWLSDRSNWPDGPYAENLRDFAQALARYGLKVQPLSIGGDGVDRPSYVQMLQEVEALWKEQLCGPATVRLKSDVPLIERLNGDVTCIPDVLWGVHDWLETSGIETLQSGDSELDPEKIAPRDHSGVIRVGLHVPKHTSKALVKAWEHRARREPNLHLFWFTSFLDRPGWGEHQSKVKASNQHNIPYRDPAEMCRQLAAMDLVISHKLHVGLVALAAGVPFLSCHGPPKARAMLQEIDPSMAVGDDWLALRPDGKVSWKTWWLVNWRCRGGAIAQARQRLQRSGLVEMKRESRRHLAPIEAARHAADTGMGG